MSDLSQPPNIAERRSFRFQRCLGRGGFGEVYLATMVSAGGLEKEVAIKVLLEGLDPRSQAVRRLRDEARLLALMNHPAILVVQDLVLLDGRIGLVMEYVEGADLDECISAPDPIPQRSLVEIVEIVADALAAAYMRLGPLGEPLQLVHRDIKPANIRVGKSGVVKVLDFGIAKARVEDRAAETKTDTVLGSFPYMAPERFDQDPTVDQAGGDIFALGCVLFEGLAKRRLFHELPMRSLYNLAFSEERHGTWVRDALAYLPEVHPDLRALLVDMLAFDPDRRPTAKQVVERCDALLPELPGDNLRRWARSHSWPEPGEYQGALEGRQLTESSFSWSGQATRGSATAWLDPEVTSAQAMEPASSTFALHPEPSAVPVRSGVPGPLGLTLGALAGIGCAGVLITIVLFASVTLFNRSLPGGASERLLRADEGGHPHPSGYPATGHRGGATGSEAPEPADLLDLAPACGEPSELVQAATAGRLPSGSRACLERQMRDESSARRVRAQHASLLVHEARRRCARSPSDCEVYEQVQPYVLDELDDSDLEAALAWARHLSDTGQGTRDEYEQIARWSNHVLQRRKDLDNPGFYIGNVQEALYLRASSALQIHQIMRVEDDPDMERQRRRAVDELLEWANYDLKLGHRNQNTLELCYRLVDEREECDRRLVEPRAVYRVSFLSSPQGGHVYLDGESLGVAPTVTTLPEGEYELRITLGEAEGVRSLRIEPGGPDWFRFRLEDGAWEVETHGL